MIYPFKISAEDILFEVNLTLDKVGTKRTEIEAHPDASGQRREGYAKCFFLHIFLLNFNVPVLKDGIQNCL